MDDVYILNEKEVSEFTKDEYTDSWPIYILILKDSICQNRLEQKLSRSG